MKAQKECSIVIILIIIAATAACENNVSTYISNTTILEQKSSAAIDKSEQLFTVNTSEIDKVQSVSLGNAADFAMLSKSGIKDLLRSVIVGNIGASPISGAAILVRSSDVTGTIYSVDAAGPPSCNARNATKLSNAIIDMEIAYNNAVGRLNPKYQNLGNGNIGGKTLLPGLYKWNSEVVISNDITISGGKNDVFIFQVDGSLTMNSGMNIILSNGVQAKNIFWVVTDDVIVGTTAHFEGNILCLNDIRFETGASINGRLLSQTAITLQMNTVTISK